MCVHMKWIVLWTLWAARLVRQPSPVVQLHQGAIRGEVSPDGSQYQFFGIPYASSQKQYRFQAPGPAPTWEGVREAVDEHIRCPQRFGKELVVGQEDCLVLNVYTPIHAHLGKSLPVMVFIHGGGFVEGSGSRLLYGPDYLVAHNVILVTINYRLGVQGFLCLGIKEAPGNAGLKDQVAALKWVQRNIRAFGGDPDNVTIFGESAGSASVSYHLVSPMSRGLFHKAIMQSGSAIASWARQPNPLQVTTNLAKFLGHDTKDPYELYKIFRKESLSKLITAKMPSTQQLKFLHLPYVPCTEPRIEGVEPFLTDTAFHVFSKGQISKVPVMVGANDEEGNFFSVYDDDHTLNSFDFAKNLPTDLEFPSELERQAVALRVKELYLGDKAVSWNNIHSLSRLHGEPYFNYPTIAQTDLLLEMSDQPIYTYLFKHGGWRNFPKLISGPINWFSKGAVHADELFYLFSMSFVPTLFETNMINAMTTLWTNFAKYGEPGSVDGIAWPAMNRSSPVSLWIGPHLQLESYNSLRPENMRFWHEVYSKYRMRSNIGHTAL